MRIKTAVPLTLLLALVAALPAQAATRFVIRGAGFGHGVGMSQYGALGMAQQGRSYREILRHYYTDTSLGRLNRVTYVRVLVQSRGVIRFTGATTAAGRRLDPTRTYSAVASAGRVALRAPDGRLMGTAGVPLRISGRGTVTLLGSGRYRGALELRPAGRGLNAINAVNLEDYVRGVVARESPSSWPAEALRAQAVAARTYAITTSKNQPGFDHYNDTRSQVYGGVAAETLTTDAAVAATRSEVVTYQGRPATTYFFSTSGGRTENSEFGFPGGAAQSWLRSVEDPADRVSPRHRWGPITMTMSQAQRRLGGLVRGTFRSIEVTQRGISPRIVRAEVVGSGGRTRTDGPTLRARFGLNDTWAYFAVIETSGTGSPDRPSEGDDVGAGMAAALLRGRSAVTGTIRPARRGTRVVVQRRVGGRWQRVRTVRTGARGGYRAPVASAGRYRVVVNRLPGPAVDVR